MPADRDLVVADVLWQTWREAKTFDASRGSVSAWLVTLARSRAIDRLRANRARKPPLAEQPVSEQVTRPKSPPPVGLFLRGGSWGQDKVSALRFLSEPWDEHHFSISLRLKRQCRPVLAEIWLRLNKRWIAERVTRGEAS